MAQTKPVSSRAIAVVTVVAGLPSLIAVSVTQQQSGELLAGLPQATNRGKACAIAHCLMGMSGLHTGVTSPAVAASPD